MVLKNRECFECLENLGECLNILKTFKILKNKIIIYI